MPATQESTKRVAEAFAKTQPTTSVTETLRLLGPQDEPWEAEVLLLEFPSEEIAQSVIDRTEDYSDPVPEISKGRFVLSAPVPEDGGWRVVLPESKRLKGDDIPNGREYATTQEYNAAVKKHAKLVEEAEAQEAAK